MSVYIERSAFPFYWEVWDAEGSNLTSISLH